VARAALGPTVDAVASATRSQSSNAAPMSGVPGRSNLFKAGFDAAWEIDIFGGTRRAVESASYSLDAQVDAKRNALVTLLADVAADYINLRGYQLQLNIVRQNAAAQRDTLDLQRSKRNAGLATDLDVAQAEAQVSGTEAQIPTLTTLAQQTIHALSVLCDEEPGGLPALLAPDGALPAAAGVIPPGLPSELLRRRPDVREAERQLAAATASIGVAVADLYPKFNLTGALGLESDKLRTLVGSRSPYWSIGPAMDWTIFNSGQTQANIRVFEARRDQAAIAYRQAVLQALEDVENALVAYEQERTRLGSLQHEVDADQRAVDLALRLNKSGLVDFLNVLTSQQSLYQTQVDVALSRQALSTDLVALYKALGGGWETFEPRQDH